MSLQDTKIHCANLARKVLPQYMLVSTKGLPGTHTHLAAAIRLWGLVLERRHHLLQPVFYAAHIHVLLLLYCRCHLNISDQKTNVFDKQVHLVNENMTDPQARCEGCNATNILSTKDSTSVN